MSVFIYSSEVGDTTGTLGMLLHLPTEEADRMLYFSRLTIDRDVLQQTK